MKLPWDKDYIKICFHVVATVVVIYAFKLCIDLVAHIVTNLDDIFSGISFFIGWIFSVCATLVIAFVIAYVFDPLVNILQKKYDRIFRRYILPKLINKKDDAVDKTVKTKPVKKRVRTKFKKRTAGTVLTFILIFLTLFILSYLSVGRISGNSNGDFVTNAINFIDKSVAEFSATYNNLEIKLKDYGVHEYTKQYIDSFSNEVTEFVKNIGNGAIGFMYSVGSGFLNVIIGLVIAFYFMRDKASIKYKFKEASVVFLPERVHRTISNILDDINAVFSGYVRGQLIDASIMAVLISSGLAILNVDFALIIGIISGFSNIIPYFGAFMAFILAVSVTLLSGTPIKALYAAILILVLQQLDGIVIGPKVVGNNVKLSPMLVIIALSVSANLFGLWGMVLAVPIFATIKLFLQRFFNRQRLKKIAENSEEAKSI